MLTNIKTLLETTEYPVENIMFSQPPALPYIVFNESLNSGGADAKNMIAKRSITVELYAETIDTTAESKIEKLLESIEYVKNRIWIESQMMFETIYDFELIEKI